MPSILHTRAAAVQGRYFRRTRLPGNGRTTFTETERGLYADWDQCTRDVVGHLRLAAGKYPDDPRLASLIGELAMGSERFRRLWARADVRARTYGRKAYRHPLVGELELHQENFTLSDESGMELLVLSAAPGSPSADALRLLASLDADGDVRPTATSPLGG
ncbi:hypothetical protein HNP84_006744 [Thermocatellispora tengchongensis]|uniref:MmyB-like transcription regulator ligand binding domain-containing protein n=1 Tax=Thermocatellispora tengchongensis TaxID=1073253 RepID=A0A840PCN3_9ACTN|nr:hypothetical protein [Thermocatellispora tengchongensis]MBB5136992.1 hypothetical protein [Thermocatellispora tengchongensis]